MRTQFKPFGILQNNLLGRKLALHITLKNPNLIQWAVEASAFFVLDRSIKIRANKPLDKQLKKKKLAVINPTEYIPSGDMMNILFRFCLEWKMYNVLFFTIATLFLLLCWSIT